MSSSAIIFVRTWSGRRGPPWTAGRRGSPAGDAARGVGELHHQPAALGVADHRHRAPSLTRRARRGRRARRRPSCTGGAVGRRGPAGPTTTRHPASARAGRTRRRCQRSQAAVDGEHQGRVDSPHSCIGQPDSRGHPGGTTASGARAPGYGDDGVGHRWESRGSGYHAAGAVAVVGRAGSCARRSCPAPAPTTTTRPRRSHAAGDRDHGAVAADHGLAADDHPAPLLRGARRATR